MPPLKLGVHQLAASETIVVRTLLWLYGGREGCNWIFADAPPYDAVLVDAPPEASPAIAHTRHLVHLTRATQAGPGPSTLARPLGADKLRQCLHQVETLLRAPAADRVAGQDDASAASAPVVAEPTPPPAMPSAAPVASPIALEDLPTLPSPLLPLPAQPESSVTAASGEAPPAHAPRYRLKRWPRAAVLRADPRRIRMATLLSRRALNARDLTVLTGYDAPECQVFMQVLRSAELLMDDAPAPSGPAPAPAAPPAAGPAAGPAAAAPQSLTRGLIASFRRRLGL